MRFYRLLLRLYPASFRVEYEAELQRTWAELTRDRGRVGAMLAAIMDVVPNAATAHATLLMQDLRYTARSLRNAPAFAVAAVLVMALGVGANTATFSVADYVLFRPLGFHEPERLVRLCDGPKQGGGWGCMNQTTPYRYRQVMLRNRSFESMGAFARDAVNLVGAGDPMRVSSALVTPDLLPVLGVRPAAGRLFDTADPTRDEQTVVLSHALWQSRFGGDRGAIGQSVTINDRPHVIIGVMPDHFRFPTDEAQLWLPMVFREADYAELVNNRLELVMRLRAGVSFEQGKAELDAIADQLNAEDPDFDPNRGFSVFKQRDEMSPRYRVMLLALSGASLAMLLLACANLGNLMLARAAGRERELAVRAALGAGRERLIRQMLTESVVLAVLGGAAGALLAMATLPFLSRLVPNTMPMASQPTMDLRVFAIAAALTAVTGLGFGLLPAMRVGGTSGFAALREGARGSAQRQGLRSALVAVEVAVSVVLLIASGLLIRAITRVQGIDPGFAAENVLLAQTALPSPNYDDPAKRADFYRRALADVRALPGVQAAGYISGRPFVMTGGIGVVLKPGEEELRDGSQLASFRIVTPQYFAAMGVPVRLGRDVSDGDTRDRQLVAVVSESFVRRRFPDQDPIGRMVQVRGEERVIVGVVGDIMVRGLERSSEPQLYVPAGQIPEVLQGSIGAFYLPKDLVVRFTGSQATLLASLREVVRRIDPLQPISNVQTLSALLGGQTVTRQAQVRVLGALAALALLLAAVGIHGILAFTVAQRDREIGVRLALGADPARVWWMVVSEGVRLAVIGVVPGVVLAWWAARGMSSLLFGVPAHDPWTFGLVAAVCVGTTVAAALFPALRASRIEPMAALRSD